MKPYPLKECQDITAPGQLIQIDIVYVNRISFLFSVDDFCGYMRMTNKSTISLQSALFELILDTSRLSKLSLRTMNSQYKLVRRLSTHMAQLSDLAFLPSTK